MNKQKAVDFNDKKFKKSKKVKKNFFILMFYGAIIGCVNGFFGGGGGMICVPVLEKLLKYPTKKAHATAISIIFPLSLISSTVYVFMGNIPSLPLLLITFGVIAGGVVGSFLLKVLPSKIVSIIFSLIMIIVGLRLVV